MTAGWYFIELTVDDYTGTGAGTPVRVFSIDGAYIIKSTGDKKFAVYFDGASDTIIEIVPSGTTEVLTIDKASIRVRSIDL